MFDTQRDGEFVKQKESKHENWVCSEAYLRAKGRHLGGWFSLCK